jgi:hypothetical protein
MINSDFNIIFTSLENYQKDIENQHIFETIEQSKIIRAEYENIKDFICDYSVPDTIGYTRS